MLYIDDEFCLYLSVLKAGFHKHLKKISTYHQYICEICEIRVKYDS